MHNVEPIAIVRMASILPGALDVASYWRNVQEGRSAVVDVPAARWAVPAQDIHNPDGAPDHTYARKGGLVQGFTLDPAGMRVDAALLADLDPLFHWVLHAGHRLVDGVDVPRERTGVALANLALPSDAFARLSRSGWRRVVRLSLGDRGRALEDAEPAAHPLNHHQASLPAGLLAHALDLQGGTLALDAACASSLYAVKLACDALWEGRADAMVAGGVARTDHLCLSVGFSQLKAISRSGVARPFDARADGLIPGEGCGLFYLRRLSDAQAAREDIQAVIAGVGLSNDGRGRGVLMPMSAGQVRCMNAAYRNAGVKPQTVGLVECHATGTPGGDTTEVQSLTEVWGPHAPPGGTAIGSAKSMLGHLLTAAGAAGLCKATAAVRDAVLPPTLNYEQPATGMDLDGSPLFVNTRTQAWNSPNGPRRAAVSAFGFGGCNAHLILEEAPRNRPHFTVAPRPAAPPPQPVAVVALATRFGRALNLQAWRQALFEGTSLLDVAPPGRWFGLEDNPQAMRALAGAYVDRLTVENPLRMRIQPAELDRMLPQQLLSVTLAEELLGDGKLLDRVKDRARTGVVMGMSMEAPAGDYAFRWDLQQQARHSPAPRQGWLNALTEQTTQKVTAEPVLGFLANLVANRISSRFDLGGPSLALAAEETSALKALEVAMLMLRRGDVDAMVVGGVDLPGDIRALWVTDPVQGYTHTQVRPWDEHADGTAPGEGAGLVVLKRLADAKADGDTVLCLVTGVGSSSDGIAGTPGAPSVRGYTQAHQRALRDAGIAPHKVGVMVGHGSGRPAEDAVEVTALHNVHARSDSPYAALVSTKPVGGHAGAASGMASLSAGILALYHRSIPPLSGAEKPVLPALWASSPFYASRKARPWLADVDELPRRAAVAAMGLDGNHVHVILEEADQPAHTTVLGSAPEALFVFNAQSTAELAEQLRAFADEAAGADLERLARARAARHVRGRRHAVTLGLVATDVPDLQAKLARARAELAAGTPQVMDVHGLFYATQPLAHQGQVAFVFPGAGNAYAGMGRELVLRYPELLDSFAQKTVAARTRSMESWVHPREVVRRRISRHDIRKPTQMLWGAGYYTQMLFDSIRQRMGVTPDVAVGYSLGESSGLFALDAWHSIDELYDRMDTWPLLNFEIAGPMQAVLRAWQKRGVDIAPYHHGTFWATWLLVTAAHNVEPLLVDEPMVHLAIINAPDECVIAGEKDACMRVISRLKCSAHPSPFAVAVHVPEVDEVADAYLQMHVLPTRTPVGTTFFSSGTGAPYHVTAENAARSILGQAVHTVDFPRLIRRVHAEGVRIFVEVGPRGSCTRWVSKILAGSRFLAVASDRKGRSEMVNLLHLAGQLAAHGVDVDLGRLYAAQPDVPDAAAMPHARHYNLGKKLDVPTPGSDQRLPDPVAVAPTPVPTPPPPAGVPVPPTVAQPIRVHPRRGPAPPPPPLRLQRTAAPPATVPVVTHRQAPPPPGVGGRLPANVMPARQAAPQPLPGRAAANQGGVGSAMPAGLPLLDQFRQTVAQLSGAHQTFLQLSADTDRALARLAPLSLGMDAPAPRPITATVISDANGQPVPQTPLPPAVASSALPAVYTRAQLKAHGEGPPSQVWGPAYAVFDHDRRMARLPNGPYLFMDRVMALGQPVGQLDTGAWLAGEYDVPDRAWYFDSNRGAIMPVAVMLEAVAQPCAFLASCTGADLRCPQDRRLRNLGGNAVVLAGVLPGSGTLHTRAFITGIREHHDVLELDFDVRMTQAGQPVMNATMLLGFFSDAALQGQALSGRRPQPMPPVARAAIVSHGTPGLPEAPLLMFDRLIALDTTGGAHGRGSMVAEKHVCADEWFFTAHAFQDPVMPASLGVEALLQMMQAYMLEVFPGTAVMAFEPVLLGAPWAWTCRGGVLPTHRKVTLQLDVISATDGATPTLVADGFVSVDGVPICRLDGVGMRATKM